MNNFFLFRSRILVKVLVFCKDASKTFPFTWKQTDKEGMILQLWCLLGVGGVGPAVHVMRHMRRRVGSTFNGSRILELKLGLEF